VAAGAVVEVHPGPKAVGDGFSFDERHLARVEKLGLRGGQVRERISGGAASANARIFGQKSIDRMGDSGTENGEREERWRKQHRSGKSFAHGCAVTNIAFGAGARRQSGKTCLHACVRATTAA
jgi:hypothetical protein